MAFATKTQAEYLADLLAQLQSLIPNADVGGASDLRFQGAALAHVLEGLSARIDWTADQIFPDSADEENLERWAATRNIVKKQPNKASGSIDATGTDGTAIPIGSTLTKADGMVYETLDAPVWDGFGNATVNVQAQTAGEAGNLDAGGALTWSPTITNIDAAATAGSPDGIVGGTELETATGLLIRYLEDLQSPPAGGTEADWKRWGLEVDGVTESFAFPLRRGMGTVDLVCFTVDGSGNRVAPGPALITDIEDHVNEVRPVTTLDWKLVTSTLVPVNVTVTNLTVTDSSFDPATVATAVQTAITDFFDTLDPGETLYVNVHLHQVITGVDGVLDYTLATPTANVVPTVDPTTIELLEAGTITVTPA